MSAAICRDLMTFVVRFQNFSKIIDNGIRYDVVLFVTSLTALQIYRIAMVTYSKVWPAADVRIES